MSGYKTYIVGLALILTAVITGILHSQKLIPLEVAGPIYAGLLPLGIMALRDAITNATKQISKENDRISEENKRLEDKLNDVISKITGGK